MKIASTLLDSELNNPAYVFILALRLLGLAFVVSLLTIHVRSVRVFRWEQSVSGGLIFTYTIVFGGLVLACALQCGAHVFQAYLCGMGSVLFGVNAITVYKHWTSASELTLVVTDLLEALGLHLQRQVYVKTTLSALLAIFLFIDFFWSLISYHNKRAESNG